MRIFFSTGEPSGELCAAALATELRALRDDIIFEGIGGERMRRAGFRIDAETTGWATLGPMSAIKNIPRLLAAMQRMARQVAAQPPDLVLLIDFGAFNVRFARALRRCGYHGPIFYGFPPSAWLDRAQVAKAVHALGLQAVVPFTHQRDFYQSLGLPAQYFGHPIAATVEARSEHTQSTNGRFVFLPGSRQQEIRQNLPRMIAAAQIISGTLPQREAVIVAADTRIETYLRKIVPSTIRIERDARQWLAWADVACVASGTAVLESVVLGVPTVAMYVLSAVNAAIARRMYRGKYITVPNLVLDRMAIPELLQDAATPVALAERMLELFHDATAQQAVRHDLRVALDSEGAMRRWAEFAISLALTGC